MCEQKDTIQLFATAKNMDIFLQQIAESYLLANAAPSNLTRTMSCQSQTKAGLKFEKGVNTVCVNL